MNLTIPMTQAVRPPRTTPAAEPVRQVEPSRRVRRIRLRDDLRLDVLEQGPHGGTPVLLLHGSTDSRRSFEPILPHLPPDWHLIVPSQRGHGDSDRPAGAYRTADFADDLARLADALDLPAMVVVGHSMGATHALRFAIDHPDRVRGLVAAGAFASFGDKPGLADFIETAIGPLTDPVPTELARAFQQDTIAGPVAPGLLDAMVAESLKVPAAVWRAMFNGLLDDEVTRDLHRIAVRTLLLWGDADAFVPLSDQIRLLRTLGDARLTAFPGTGHALHWEQPVRFADAVIGFVGGLPGGLPSG